MRADAAATGLGPATLLMIRAMRPECLDPLATATGAAMEHASEVVESILADDMAGAEQMLAAHAVAMNAMFMQQAALMDKAGTNSATRAALAAQRQCTAAIVALTAIRALQMEKARPDGAR